MIRDLTLKFAIRIAAIGATLAIAVMATPAAVAQVNPSSLEDAVYMYDYVQGSFELHVRAEITNGAMTVTEWPVYSQDAIGDHTIPGVSAPRTCHIDGLGECTLYSREGWVTKFTLSGDGSSLTRRIYHIQGHPGGNPITLSRIR